MAVRIRLTRTGRRHHAQFRIGVFDSRTRRDGRYLENLGTYNPHGKSATEKIKLNAERYEYWVSVGAKPTENLAQILKSVGVK